MIRVDFKDGRGSPAIAFASGRVWTRSAGGDDFVIVLRIHAAGS